MIPKLRAVVAKEGLATLYSGWDLVVVKTILDNLLQYWDLYIIPGYNSMY